MPNTTPPADTPRRRAGGRPRSADPRTMRGFRLTAFEFATLQALGGPAWLSKTLARAKLTPQQRAERDAAIGNAQQGLDLDTARDPLVF